MRLRELAGRVEQEVRDVGQLRKLLGYHGNPSVSEASGSAQSEAQESSSQTTITSSSLEPETDQGAGMTVAQARDVLLGDIRYCIAAVRGNSSAPVGDCSSFVDLLIEAVRAEVPREASSREGEQQTDQGAGWLPIESAPKDGTEILCYWPNYSYEIPREFESGHQVIAIARWTINHRLDGVSESADATERRMSGAYFHDTNECDDYGLALPEHAPTHWMPLPSPPSSGKIAERSSADNT